MVFSICASWSLDVELPPNISSRKSFRIPFEGVSFGISEPTESRGICSPERISEDEASGSWNDGSMTFGGETSAS